MKLLGLFLLLFTSNLFAQTIPENPDVAKILVELFTNWSGLGSLGAAMSIIVLVVQVLKWTVLDKWFEKTHPAVKIIKQAIVYLLGMVYSVLFAVEGGTQALQATIGLLTGGGAIALYNILKPLWEKK